MENEEKVIKLLKELSGKEGINKNDKLLDDIGLDSIGMVTLLIAIEDLFSIELDESDMNPYDLSTVSNVVELVAKYYEVDHEKES